MAGAVLSRVVCACARDGMWVKECQLLECRQLGVGGWESHECLEKRNLHIMKDSPL